MENSNKKFWTGFLAGAVSWMLISILGFGFYFAVQKEDREPEIQHSYSELLDYETCEKIETIQTYIEESFLYERNLEECLRDGLYRGMLESLDDPYSVYYDEEEYLDLLESNSGEYSGIGCYVEQNVETGQTILTRPMKGSPAEEAGVKPGDILLEVDGISVEGMDLDQVVSLVKGEEGSQVLLHVMREGEPEPFDIAVTRRTVEVDSVTYSMMEGQIGYVALTGFEEVSPGQFDEALDDLTAQGMKALVIDVRNNPGGSLSSVLDILNRVLPEGPVLKVVDKYGESQQYMTDSEESVDVPMAVLINSGSASASEVFSGAMKDRGAAILVGTNSFGKGIVQTILPLDDGSAMKITTEEFFTPSGNTIHGVGIAPDVEVELPEELQKELEIPFEQDTQLQAAIQELNQMLQ